jgi:hypothetical protein
MASSEKRQHHVLDSTYRIGIGLEISLIRYVGTIIVTLIPPVISLPVQDFMPGLGGDLSA